MDLRTWRESKGYTADKVAGLIGITQPSLTRIENGEQWPDAAVLDKIVKLSKGEISLDDLHKSFMTARRKREKGKAA